MGMFASYDLWMTDWTGAQLAHLSGPDLMSFSWQLKLNGPGAFRYEVVAETNRQDLFETDYGFKLMRDYGAGLYEEFCGIGLDTDEWLQSGEVDEHYFAVYGLSPEWMLDQPLLWPTQSGNPDFPMYDVWWMHGPADDVMKAMVSESMGGGAATERQFAQLAIEGNKSEGAWSCYEGRYVRLLEALQGISDVRGLTDFRVVRLPAGGFEFRTYSPYYGTDRRRGHNTKPTIFSLELENVLNPKRQVMRHAEATAIIGGWQGGGADRDLFYATNTGAIAESPFRRRELFMDVRDVIQPDTITSILDQALIDEGKQEIVEFSPIQTGACLYGRDWNLGDLVTLDLWDQEYDMRIIEVDGRINGQNEEEIQGTAELWTRAEAT